MDALTQAALVGTARATTDALATNTPIDALVPADGAERERTLLLRAGALAIYHEAGQVPARHTDPLPEPAPDETLPVCSPAAAAIVQILLKTHQELMPEALDRLISYGLRLPPELVAVVLAARPSTEWRPRLRRVIGARGHWLARFNSAWAWATETPVAETTDQAEAETIWQDGQPSQRIEVFTRVRHADPVQSRAWLAATWRREKADMRADLLSALATNLSSDDEPLLEAGLDDKVDRVRAAAVRVLATLPTSGINARMQSRADVLLAGYTPGALQISERVPWKDEYARDGITNDPPRGTAKSDWLLRQILSRVPPDHWSARFGATPAELITAALGSAYEEALMQGWSAAAATYASADWLMPLWEWWSHPNRARLASHQLRDDLLAQMPQAEAEATLLRLIDSDQESWSSLLNSRSGTWSEFFTHTYLDRLLAYVASLAPDATTIDTNWPNSFRIAACGIPSGMLSAIPSELAIPQMNTYNWQFTHWARAWQEMQEIVSLRLRIRNEIIPPTEIGG